MGYDGERPQCDECGRTAAHTHRYDTEEEGTVDCECRRDKETGAKLVCRSCEAEANGDRYVRGHCLSCDFLGTLEDGEHCQPCLDNFERRYENEVMP